MDPRMSPSELNLFTSFVRHASDYLEFGCGGSTLIASGLVRSSVTAVDSSSEWIRQVKTKCQEVETKIVPKCHLIDIGPTGDWGYPTDANTQDKWTNYHSQVWDECDLPENYLCLVDGRFRVACFLQTLLHCGHESFILVHDFRSRPHYHVMGEFAEEIASAEDLSVFRPAKHLNNDGIRNALSLYSTNPS